MMRRRKQSSARTHPEGALGHSLDRVHLATKDDWQMKRPMDAITAESNHAPF